MLFNSFTFVIFFTLVCIAMAVTNLPVFQAMPQDKRLRVRHIILLLAGYVFYGCRNLRRIRFPRLLLSRMLLPSFLT